MKKDGCAKRIFFFQAEDGIRDIGVTGVQTCALPISVKGRRTANFAGALLTFEKYSPSLHELSPELFWGWHTGFVCVFI